MDRKTCLISGATSGIGRAAARELYRRGYDLVLLGRDKTRCEDTIAELGEINSEAELRYYLVDLSSLQSVQELGKELRRDLTKLDILVNNAGAVFMRDERSVDGLEMTWALNHFGYFWLTREVLPLLKRASSSIGTARIVNVSSAAHQRARFSDLSKVFERKGLLGYFTYGETKLANIWYTLVLADRLAPDKITVNSMHPGFVATRFSENNGLMALPLKMVTGIFGLSPEEGAETIVYLVDSDEVDDTTGGYFVKCKQVEPSKTATRLDQARELWRLTEEKTEKIIGAL